MGESSWNVAEFMVGVERAFDDHSISSAIHVEPFAQRMLDDPDGAIDEIFKVYNKGLDTAYTGDDGVNDRFFIQSIVGGPCEIIPCAVYNAVGTAYPYLNRGQKDRALGKIFGILDRINWAYINGERGAGQTPGIREPLLLTDISIARHMYWPGLYEGKSIIKRFSSFQDLASELIDENGMFKTNKVRSDFVVGYSLLRAPYSDFGEDYIEMASPSFLDRVLRGAVALRFCRVKDEKQIQAGTERLKELLPKSLHDKIEPLRQEGGWVDINKFP